MRAIASAITAQMSGGSGGEKHYHFHIENAFGDDDSIKDITRKIMRFIQMEDERLGHE